MNTTIVIRKKSTSRNKNHNLYKNGGSWWCSLTVWEEATTRRVRFSLKTKDVKEARAIRDNIIKEAQAAGILIWL